MNKRKYKDLSPLSEVIRIIFQQGSLKKMTSVKKISLIWSEIIDKNICLHTDVCDIKDGTLYVNIDNPTWSMELKFQENTILQKINEKCDESTIHSIIYRIHSVNKKK